MRPSAEEVTVDSLPSQSVSTEVSRNEKVTEKGEFSRQADISLFVSLVESCRGQASQKVSALNAITVLYSLEYAVEMFLYC